LREYFLCWLEFLQDINDKVRLPIYQLLKYEIKNKVFFCLAFKMR